MSNLTIALWLFALVVIVCGIVIFLTLKPRAEEHKKDEKKNEKPDKHGDSWLVKTARFIMKLVLVGSILLVASAIAIYYLSTPHVVPAPPSSTDFCHTIEIRDGALMLEETDRFCRVFERSTVALKFGYTKDIYGVEGIPDKRYWVIFEWHVGQPYGDVKLIPIGGDNELSHGKFRCVNYTPNSYEGLRLQYWKDGDMSKLAREILLAPNSNRIRGVPEINQAPWEN